MSFHPMKSAVRLCAALFLVCAALAPRTIPAAHAQDDVVDEIVAVVSDQIVLKSEVDAVVANYLQQQRLPWSEALWMDALNELIGQEVLKVAARRDTNITVQEEQVDQALDQRIEFMASQVGGEDRLEELYGRSIVRIRADLRDELRDQLLADQLRQSKIQNIRITPTESEEWFRRFAADSLPVIPHVVRLNHIVRFPELTEEAREEAREIITAIRDSVVTGAGTFEDMARRFSEDPGSASAGGRIDNTNLGDLVPEFGAVASRNPIGETSQVFESPFGYHIVRVNDRRGEIVDFNHILIRIDDSAIDPSETIAFLTAVRDSALHLGVPFERLAKQHSQEESTAQLGGRVVDPRSGERDLVRENLGPLWLATLDTMQVGEISLPTPVQLESPRQAYHIVHLVFSQEEHTVSLETDYERIEQFALQEKRAQWMQDYIDTLREEIYVDLRGKARTVQMAER